MAKKIDDATKLLIDSLPENLQKLATSAVEVGYFSQMDFNAANEADEVPSEEQEEVMDFFTQDLGLEMHIMTMKMTKKTAIKHAIC